MDNSLCVLLVSIYVVVFVGLVFWTVQKLHGVNKKPKPALEKKVEKFVYTHDEFMRDMLNNVPLDFIMGRCRAVGGVPRRPKKEELKPTVSVIPWTGLTDTCNAGSSGGSGRFDDITVVCSSTATCVPVSMKITLDSSR